MFAGMKMNFNKSEILALTPKALQRPPSTTQFAIARDHIKCLGIKIERLPFLLYNLNYPSLIAKIIKQLDLWTDLPLVILWLSTPYKDGELHETSYRRFPYSSDTKT